MFGYLAVAKGSLCQQGTEIESVFICGNKNLTINRDYDTIIA
jgi:hypothetical protein